jgi:Protein of unknown function (DUF2568)
MSEPPRWRGGPGGNLVVRFLLELAALAAVGYWGFSSHSGVTQWVLGLGAPVAVAAVWGLFVSPKAKVDLPRPAAFAIELLVWAAAALALAASGQPALAIVFAILALVSGTLNFLDRP